MSTSELMIYSVFAAGCSLALVGWILWLVKQRQLSLLAPELLLTGRDRIDFERHVFDGLQVCMDQDPETRGRLFCLYQEFSADLPAERVGEWERSRERSDRFVTHAVRQLDDVALLRLSELLGCLGGQDSWVARRRQYQRSHRRWSRGQGGAAILGLIVFAFVLSFPPWVAQLRQETRLIGSGSSTEVLESRRMGHHWIGNPGSPEPQVTRQPTESLRRLQYHRSGWRVDYGRLTGQLVVVATVVSIGVWLVRRPHNKPTQSRTFRNLNKNAMTSTVCSIRSLSEFPPP